MCQHSSLSNFAICNKVSILDIAEYAEMVEISKGDCAASVIDVCRQWSSALLLGAGCCLCLSYENATSDAAWIALA